MVKAQTKAVEFSVHLRCATDWADVMMVEATWTSILPCA